MSQHQLYKSLTLKNLFYIFLLIICFSSCKNNEVKLAETLASGNTLDVKYAQGFSIIDYQDFKLLTVKSPWPDAEQDFTYALVKEGQKVPDGITYTHKINIPLERVVLTSTTFIPAMESLGKTETLVGFPSLDYISSKATRKRIDAGAVRELGANESINTEILLELQPDAVVGFAIDGQNKTFNTIEKNNIPVIYNGDWIESSPLGKAEWLKFFGALYDEINLAEEQFNTIEKDYLNTKELATSAQNMPIVLSGSMFKDVWYLPYGDSWQAQFIKDAYGRYVYDYTRGKGSISLAFERVLDKAQNADVWIGPGSYTSYKSMLEESPHYGQFDAFKNKRIYGSGSVTGETGGMLFYELGPNRPDLILKDLVKAFHPKLLPDYEPTFMKPLD